VCRGLEVSYKVHSTQPKKNNNLGLPPLAELSKNDVLKSISLKTGDNSNNNTAVITTAHTNRANSPILLLSVLIFTTVVIYLTATLPNNKLRANKYMANIAKPTLVLKGGASHLKILQDISILYKLVVSDILILS
jgi:hypothetical protein